MSFAKPKEVANSVSTSLKPCSQCKNMTSQETLIKYGSMCGPCFHSYCRQAPDLMTDIDKFSGHPRAWAKRIMNKHECGIFVNQVALKMAKEALA